MAGTEAEFAIAETEGLLEQQAIPDFIRDEAEVEANRQLIWQRQAEANVLFDELEADIVMEEAAPEQPDGAAA
ncbi:hypothetical protein D1007_27754 [Hordeum vulgare]|nr:hypothetical protein D1007_27754 [Hordeum vulgare]